MLKNKEERWRRIALYSIVRASHRIDGNNAIVTVIFCQAFELGAYIQIDVVEC